MELDSKPHPHHDALDTDTPVSSADILACWSDYSWQQFVPLGELSPFDRIVLTTHNHVYEIVVTCPEKRAVLVRGGTIFPTFVSASIVGSRGRGALEAGAVAVGLRLLFEMDGGRWLTTTTVETVAVVPAGALHREGLVT